MTYDDVTLYLIAGTITALFFGLWMNSIFAGLTLTGFIFLSAFFIIAKVK